MFESVLSTNFEAVCRLRLGRFDESMSFSKITLAAVQAAEVADVADHSPVTPTTATVVSVSLDDSKSVGSSFDLFNRAFIFEGVHCLENTDENASLCAAVGLYNMALAMKCKGGQACLRKATDLFHKVFSIIRACAPAPMDSLSALFLATTLNIIACQSELYGHSAAQPWINVYHDLFAWATQAPGFEAEEHEIFASQAVIFASQHFTTAAAA